MAVAAAVCTSPAHKTCTHKNSHGGRGRIQGRERAGTPNAWNYGGCDGLGTPRADPGDHYRARRAEGRDAPNPSSAHSDRQKRRVGRGDIRSRLYLLRPSRYARSEMARIVPNRPRPDRERGVRRSGNAPLHIQMWEHTRVRAHALTASTPSRKSRIARHFEASFEARREILPPPGPRAVVPRWKIVNCVKRFNFEGGGELEHADGGGPPSSNFGLDFGRSPPFMRAHPCACLYKFGFNEPLGRVQLEGSQGAGVGSVPNVWWEPHLSRTCLCGGGAPLKVAVLQERNTPGVLFRCLPVCRSRSLFAHHRLTEGEGVT